MVMDDTKSGPPFHESLQITKRVVSINDGVLPPFYQSSKHHTGCHVAGPSLRRINSLCPSTVHSYLEESFDITRLNDMHSWLWIAGLPKVARPLHEQADRILIKPLPGYLLHTIVWLEHLSHNDHVRKAVVSFMLSYLWLICEYSDFCIAKQHHLLPASVEWHEWAEFAGSLHDYLYVHDQLQHDILPRYQYGELRLQRLSFIYRCKALHPRTFQPMVLIHGYGGAYTTYTNFFERNTRWFVTTVIYVGLVLAAMEVALQTGRYPSHDAFSRICAQFALVTILAPLGFAAIVAVLLVFAVYVNATYANSTRKLLSKAARYTRQSQA